MVSWIWGQTKLLALKTPTSDSDASTKKYVDDKVEPLDVIDSGYTMVVHNDTISVSGTNTSTCVVLA